MQPSVFLENLRRLHRDERSFLTSFVSGASLAPLRPQFLAEVRTKLGIEVPEMAFLGFDYQMSRIHAAAVMASAERPGPHPSGGGIDKGNQEHVDLLLAWESGEGVELLIVETEGVTGWSGKQLLSKAHWLGDVFGYGSGTENYAWLRPRFAIASPVPPPVDMITLEWPEWMVDAEGRPAWLQMPVPRDLLKVTRTMADGSVRATGGFWLV
ncbi:MAG: hypothetical protein GEU28_14185, partial [Dehalococcoidia bacterium]|nr:hypothetical protein [Dehalococcoidia bacterium]